MLALDLGPNAWAPDEGARRLRAGSFDYGQPRFQYGRDRGGRQCAVTRQCENGGSAQLNDVSRIVDRHVMIRRVEGALAKLTFQKNAGIVILTSSDDRIIGVWKAHSNVESGKQPFAAGTWNLLRYNPHPELAAPSTSRDCWSGRGIPPRSGAGLGCFGIYLFHADDAAGLRQVDLGVHSGRTEAPPSGTLNSLGGVTSGCIRVPPAVMLTFNQVHFGGDLIRSITVQP